MNDDGQIELDEQGTPTFEDKLRKLFPAEMEAVKPSLKSIQGGRSSEPEKPLAGPLPMQMVGDIKIPKLYQLWSDGLYIAADKEDGATAKEAEHWPDEVPSLGKRPPDYLRPKLKRIATGPIWLSDFGYAVDTKEHLVLLSFRDPHGNLHEHWVTRDHISVKRTLVGLSTLGLPVTENSAGLLVAYLTQLEGLNRTRERRAVGSRVGYYEDESEAVRGWLIGKRWIGSGRLSPDPRGQGEFAAKLGTNGSLHHWLAKLQELWTESPVVRLTIAASFAAPLLELFQHRTFFWFLQGNSTFGKTALQKFAMSAWGNPKGLKLSFNASQLAIPETLGAYSDLPLFVDERQAAGERFDFAKFIYDVTEETGRVRTKRTGGTFKRPQWKTVVLASGEEHIIGSSDRGGQRNRVVEVSISKHPKLKASMRALHDFSAACYGHAGPLLLEKLAPVLEDPMLRGKLQAKFQSFVDALMQDWAKMGETPANVAAVALASALIEWLLLGVDREEAYAHGLSDGHALLAWMETTSGDAFLPPEERALRILRSFISANPGRVADSNDRIAVQRATGLIGYWIPEGVFLIPEAAATVFQAAGFMPNRAWQVLQEAGWVEMGAEAKRLNAIGAPVMRRTLQRRIAGRRQRGYLLRKEALEGVDAQAELGLTTAPLEGGEDGEEQAFPESGLGSGEEAPDDEMTPEERALIDAF